MRELDAIRGLAILLVLFFHGMASPLASPLPPMGQFLFDLAQYGWAGVNLFFVLSGFLITGILCDHRSAPDYYRRFYLRRARRILPALYATLLGLLLAGFVGWRFCALAALFLANCGQIIGVPLQYAPLWSLAVEEHFYFVWPVLVRRVSNKGLCFTLWGIVLVSPLLRGFNFLLPVRTTDMSPLYTWLNLDGLAMGALLAIWVREPGFSRKALMRAVILMSLAGLLGSVISLRSPLLLASFSQSACDLGASGLLAGTLFLASSRWHRLVESRVLEFFGFISYGLYLVHVVAFALADKIAARGLLHVIAVAGPTAGMLLRFLLGSSLAIALAYLSRRSLEEVFLRKNREPEAASEALAQPV
jgi:peptidoglycan/LPS O-acetylase OafA/YrhL